MVGKIFMLDDDRLILENCVLLQVLTSGGQFETKRVNNMIINVLLNFMLSVTTLASVMHFIVFDINVELKVTFYSISLKVAWTKSQMCKDLWSKN